MKKNKNALRAAFTTKNKGRLFLASLSCLLTAGVNLGIAWLLQQMIDTVSGVPGALSLTTLALYTGILLVTLAGIKILQIFTKPPFLQKAMEQYKNTAFQQLIAPGGPALCQEQTAPYLTAFSTDAMTVETNYLETWFSILQSLALSAGSLCLMVCYSPVLTGISCAFFLWPVVVSLCTGHKAEKAERAVSDQNAAFLSTLQDCLGGFAVMKQFRAEKALFALFTRNNHASRRAACQKQQLLTAMGGLAGIAGVLAQFGTFLCGGYLALAGWGITPGVLLIFLDLTANVITPLQQLPALFTARKAAGALIEKLAGLLPDAAIPSGGRVLSPLRQGIALESVCFGYEPGHDVLHDVTARFEAGKCYAIVGASGSGKSTLFELLVSARRACSGRILYDGCEVNEIAPDSLFRTVSLIQQSVFLFRATIRDNITLFQDFPPDEVDRAIRLAGLGPLINKRGENALCGENGLALSGGEKQRIAIARSLCKRSQVLLADEITSALDAATARQVTDALLSLSGVTRLIITHQPDAPFLSRCDGIVVMKNGHIEEQGAFSRLMNRKGTFYSLSTLSP